jgi:hypothetical protein
VSIEFPLQNKRTSFGIIPNSVIPIEVLTLFGYQKIQFILDTGADVTMMPHHMAKVIGLDLKSCTKSISYGIEGNGVCVYAGKITIRIGKEQLLVRCLFSEKENTPYILGRADVFSAFNITFDNRAGKIIFTKLRSTS